MKEILGLGWFLGFAVMFINIAFAYIYSYKLIGVLKSKHPEVWNSLGQPLPLFGNSVQTSLKVRKFIKNTDVYVKDEEISKLAKALRISKTVQFCAFALAIMCFVLIILAKHN
jgi:hypothetical protein